MLQKKYLIFWALYMIKEKKHFTQYFKIKNNKTKTLRDEAMAI